MPKFLFEYVLSELHRVLNLFEITYLGTCLNTNMIHCRVSNNILLER